MKKLINETANNKSFHYLRNHINKDTFHLSDSLIDKLSTKDFKGPYSSFCNFCLTKNMNFYSALDEKQAKNIVNLIK